MGEDPLVRLRGAVVLSRGFPLLSGVDLTLDPGTLHVLTGANGAGKTSLLRLLGGVIALSGGEGVVAGIDLTRGDRRLLRRRVGWLGHEGSFYGELSVEENLRVAARALDVAGAAVGQAAGGAQCTAGLQSGRDRQVAG